MVHLNKSVIELTQVFWSLVETITSWNADVTEHTDAIKKALQETLSIEELKETIENSTRWIIENQAIMMEEISELKATVEKLKKMN